MTISAQIAAFCRRTATMRLPAEVEERARLCLADHLHAAMHGMRSDTGRRMARYLGPAEALDAERAALLLGSISAVHEIDDVHQDTSMHPGSVIVAAALAAASGSPVSGREMLAAIAVGYEVGIRLSIAAGHRHYHFFHATATCGAVAAAATASMIHGLDEAETAHAIGIAVTATSGLWEDINERAVGIKHVHSGFAAERGIRAAKLAKLGLQSAPRSIEGEKGFLAALARPGTHAPGESLVEGEALRAIMLDGLGSRWTILRNIYKRYPFCLACFEPLEGIGHLVTADTNLAAQIDRVRVAMQTPAARMVEQANPQDEFQAKFSAPFALALVLTGRDPERVPLPPDWLERDEIRQWYPRIEVVAMDDLPRRKALVTVTTKGGATVEADRPFRNLDQTQVWARFSAAARQYLVKQGPDFADQVARYASLPAAAAIMPLLWASLRD